MKKNYFPIMRAAVIIISASARPAEAATTTCSQNAPNTECLPVVFHNQSMNANFLGNGGLRPPHEYSMKGEIKVIPLYGSNLEKGQYTKINLFDQGEAMIRFDTASHPYTGPVEFHASGHLVEKFPPFSHVHWECSEETYLEPSNLSQLNFEVQTTVNYAEGTCMFENDTNYCQCTFEVTPSLQNLKEQ